MNPVEMARALDGLEVEMALSPPEALEVARGNAIADFIPTAKNGVRITERRATSNGKNTGKLKEAAIACVAACSRIEFFLVRQGIISIPRRSHLQLLGWLSLYLPFQRDIGLVVAAALLIALDEHANDIGDIEDPQQQHTTVTDRLQSRLPLNVSL